MVNLAVAVADDRPGRRRRRLRAWRFRGLAASEIPRGSATQRASPVSMILIELVWFIVSRITSLRKLTISS
jgi:hypothetical protein